jgi:uncharacterized protein
VIPASFGISNPLFHGGIQESFFNPGRFHAGRFPHTYVPNIRVGRETFIAFRERWLSIHETGNRTMQHLTPDYVRLLFASLENGKSDEFFRHVKPDVNWTVMGTHPLAGTYHDREIFIASTFGRLNKVLKEGVLLRVTGIIVSGDTAAVELEALSTALNGKPFSNRYCWICRFESGQIVEVRAYLDSALVQMLLDENEPKATG